MLAGWHWSADGGKCGIYVFGSSKYNEYYYTVCSRLSKNQVLQTISDYHLVTPEPDVVCCGAVDQYFELVSAVCSVITKDQFRITFLVLHTN